MRLPAARIRGAALSAARALAGHSASARLLRLALEPELGIDRLATLGPEARGRLPEDAQPIAGRPPRRAGHTVEESLRPGSARELARRFQDGSTTPEQVTRDALAALRNHRGQGAPMTVFDDGIALRDAAASTERHRAGRPRGPLDGVPFVVKEQLDVVGLPTRAGTSFLGDPPAAVDATVVARLRSAGAVLLGHSAMTEFGLSPLGANVHRAMPRNPHDAGHLAGGSSTGSAVAVAAGHVPFAVGADGGGSIRIPSALCGVYGIKPTFGRTSRAGNAYDGTMDHVGPIASTVEDLGHFLDAVASEPDPRDPATRYSAAGIPAVPEAGFAAAARRTVEGLRIGVLFDEGGDEGAPWPAAAPAVALACRAALRTLEGAGATLVPLRIPLAAHAPAVGYLSIGLEAYASLRHAFTHQRDRLGADVVCLLGALSTFDSDAYLDAQRLRTTLRREVARALGDVDLIALPTTATAAPPVSDDEAQHGFLDGAATHAMCRYAFLGNLTGLPAGTAPVGKDGNLPVGLQLVGDAWDEATVLAALATLERR